MSAIICDCCGKETTKNHRVIVTSTLAGVVMCHNCEGSIPVPIPHLKETCEKFQENGIGCVDCFCDKSCQDFSVHKFDETYQGILCISLTHIGSA